MEFILEQENWPGANPPHLDAWRKCHLSKILRV